MPRSNFSSISSNSSASNISSQQIRKIAAKQANAVLSSRAEKKWYVLDISNNPTVSTPSLTDLTSLIVQGDQYNQRNGDQIRLRKIVMNFQAIINPSATWTGARVLIVRSKGGSQTVGSILVPHVSSVPLYGAVNTANVDIMYDRRYLHTTYGSNAAHIVQADIKLGKALVQWQAGSTTAKKPVYLLIMSDAVTLSPSNQGYLVLKYFDI